MMLYTTSDRERNRRLRAFSKMTLSEGLAHDLSIAKDLLAEAINKKQTSLAASLSRTIKRLERIQRAATKLEAAKA